MQIVISGIPVDVERKNIKNLHTRVKPPDGHVVVSVPLAVSDAAAEAYVRMNLPAIRRAIDGFRNQPRAAKRQWVSGETLYIWGVQYFLRFQSDNRRNGFHIHGREAVLSMRAESTVAQREAYMREQYRAMLKAEIARRLPVWEEKTGLKCVSWGTKYMVTKWGTCNTDAKRLWFNVQLAQKPMRCLDYIILHELAHLVSRRHDDAFKDIMDVHMPCWSEVRQELNDTRLDYYETSK